MKRKKLSPTEIIQHQTVQITKINIPYEFQRLTNLIQQMQRSLEKTIDVDEVKRKRKQYEKEITKRKQLLKRKIDRYMKVLEEEALKNGKRDLEKVLKMRNISIPNKLKKDKQ